MRKTISSTSEYLVVALVVKVSFIVEGVDVVVVVVDDEDVIDAFIEKLFGVKVVGARFM